MNCYKYHLTVHHPNRKLSVSPQDFTWINFELENIGILVVDAVKETGKYGGDHVHCIAYSRHKIVYKDLSRIMHYRLYWKEVKSEAYLENIKEYHKKDQPQTELHKSFAGQDTQYYSPHTSDEEDID